MVDALLKIGECLAEMHQIADNGMLFAKRCHHDNLLTRAASVINSECFYGRAAGFQVCAILFSRFELKFSNLVFRITAAGCEVCCIVDGKLLGISLFETEHCHEVVRFDDEKQKIFPRSGTLLPASLQHQQKC